MLYLFLFPYQTLKVKTVVTLSKKKKKIRCLARSSRFFRLSGVTLPAQGSSRSNGPSGKKRNGEKCKELLRVTAPRCGSLAQLWAQVSAIPPVVLGVGEVS